MSEVNRVRDDQKDELSELNGFFDESYDLLGIINMQGKLHKYNKTWMDMLGYEKDEIDSMSFFDFFHQEDKGLLEKTVEKLALGNEDVELEGRILGSDQSVRFIQWRLKRFNNHIHITGRDFTKRKQIEDALNEERSLMGAIFDSSPGMLYLYDENSKLVRWNKRHETMTGYSGE